MLIKSRRLHLKAQPAQPTDFVAYKKGTRVGRAEDRRVRADPERGTGRQFCALTILRVPRTG